MKKTSEDQRVFRVGRRNVVLNFRSQPESEFGFYANAFHEAAQTLANEFMGRPGYSDLEALPIVFLYRHALELYFKSVLLVGNQLLEMNGDEIPAADIQAVLSSHRLTPLLPHFRKILKAAGFVWNWPDDPHLKSFEDLRKVLREVEAVDADSFAFRYPITKKGAASVPHNFTFDLVEAVKILDRLVEMLDAAHTGLEATYEAACDAFTQTYSYE